MAMAALNQSSPTLSISMDAPHAQNTALVLEFRCLFTPDLRRKQKRWQDGRLKFHTFNKRVMVYDDRSNFVGDTHWRKDYEFNEGEELELERGGILVEVSECIGKRDQDLTELVDKRVKEREGRVAAKKAATPMRPPASLNGLQKPARSALLGPKSLNAILGDPTEHYGKAIIPKQSPFEQRQQAIRDENQNDRPAKRRKQDDTPPSKSGYAQNLMGTKLNLASSRPASTAPIRYEPLRIKRTSAMTIDLTVEDHSTADKARTAMARQERTVPKPQRQRPNKSPPGRSGYASSLTGASLNLKAPESYSSKQSVSGLTAGKNGFKTYLSQERGSSSSVELESGSRIEDEVSEERRVRKAHKQKELVKEKTRPPAPNPEPLNRSSSPPVISRPATISKPSTTNSSIIQETPGNQPVSTLRIKSRAPRKMMMLMERPISRSLVPREPSETSQNGLDRRRDPEPTRSVVLSQATMRLDAFREQQERRLQERLNGKPAETHSDKSSSSPVDRGVDHRMIDNLLSHRKMLAERHVLAVHDEAPHPKPSARSETDSEEEEVVRGSKPKPPAKSVDAIKTGDPEILITLKLSPPREPATKSCTDAQSDGPLNNPGIPKGLPQSTILSIDTTDRIAPTQSVPLTAAIATTAGIEKSGIGVVTRETGLDGHAWSVQDGSSSRKPNGLDERHSRDEPNPPRSSSNIASPDRASNGSSPQSGSPVASSLAVEANKLSPPPTPVKHAAIERISAKPLASEMNLHDATVNSVTTTRKIASIPAHFGSTIMSANAHFRAIFQSSASPPNQAIQDPPPAPSEQPILPSATTPEAQKLEPASSDVAIKASPRASPPMAAGLSSEAQSMENTRSTISVNNTSKLTLPTIPNPGPDQRKQKLVNPATRGPSVQMTVNRTVNALVPSFNALPSMAPPPPRISSRTGKDPASDEALANRTLREPVKEVAPGGPWSRESFDLFGSWRPPGRSTGTDAVNG